ncbi:S8 family serine peptidase [Kitasatospora sp. NBC_01266]|uniref:S8 family serine peptidase n=1 Tax=Kitasatospora sp. NBC_01266 TaxID=2903572 RepID=UPI002E347BDB|nr:S8 family serine peptidase [Kitasatospora sp. NBC_01266]
MRGSRRRRVGTPGSAATAGTVALLVGGLLLPVAAGAAWADGSGGGSATLSGAAPTSGSAAPSGSASPAPGDTLPGVTQVLASANGQQPACLTASTKDNRLTPWPQTFLRPDQVWPLTQGAGVTVAVLGSGVADGTGLLSGRLDRAAKLSGGGDPAQDCVGHGSFLAALIAAGQRPGVGFAGIAPGARILAVGVTDNTGASTADLLAQGIRAAADQGARVIDVGVTVPAGSDALAAAVHEAVGKGALVIAPAAPDPVPGAQAGGASAAPAPVFPAAYPEVLSVRDLGPGGTLAQSGGSAVGGRVDLAAPGDAVMGVGPSGGGYYTGAGPSFATAFVAGSAALVLGYQPKLTESQLIGRLEATAYRSGGAVPDPQVGYGSVDPVAAVTTVLPQPQSTPSAAPAASPSPLAVPPARPASAAPRQAGGVALGALGVVALVALGAVVVPRGRARGWRPPQTGADGEPE